MALVERHPLDDRIGFGLVPLDWSRDGTSRERAEDERHHYTVTAIAGKKLAYEVRRKGDERRFYSVRYDPARNRGWCSCLGFKFKTVDKGEGPCVHLWILKLERP